jgi:Asp-tRNA(Asn)/Glu-tRNA(Gln) amidotransferase A subunit family amidase
VTQPSVDDAARELGDCLRRIDAHEVDVRAWQHLRPREELMAEVRAAAARAPLHGLPVAVKDVIDVAGLPTTFGSSLYADNRPARDAACVALLRRAGAIVVGKAVSTEFAYFSPGKTRNPHDPGRTPGGSSSGSAAAVATGMARVGLGTQTAGSVVRPAAYCGVVGYVASHGELPLRGVQPLAPSLDSLGLLARSVEDVRRVRWALLEGSPPPAEARPAAAPRIAIWDGGGAADIDPAMRGAIDAAASALGDLGGQLFPLECSEPLGELTQLHGRIMAFEAARTLAVEADAAESISPQLRALLEQGRATTYAEHRAAWARADRAGAAVREAWQDADAVLAPAAPGPAPRGLGSTGSPDLSRAWQLLGLPAVAIPARRDGDGLPLGVQLVGPRRTDDELLVLAGRVHRALEP